MESSRYRPFLLLAALLETGFMAFTWLDDLERHAVEFIAAYLVMSIFYIVCCFLITRPVSDLRGGGRLLGLIWAAGLVFRLTVFPLDPGLSEDLYRYRWQGKLQAAGGNPYTETPEDPRWQELRDATWPRVNRKNLPSVYGPVLEHLYNGYYRLATWVEPDESRQAWLFKIPFALLELGVAAVLSRLLAAMSLPRHWLLIYLWSPLVVVEYWAQGHNDPLAILLVLLALLAALKNRWHWAFAALTAATLSKFWPAVLFPFFLLQRVEGRWSFRWKSALVSLPIAVAVSWPYLRGIYNVTELLEGFAGGWRNNDSLYAIVYWAAEEDFERGAMMVTRLLAAALILLWSLQLPLVKAAKWAVVLLLFFSANCFPWYLGWMIPFLAIYPNAALLLWTALVALAYQVLIGYEILGVWKDSDEFRLLEYLPVYALLLSSGAVRRLSRWRYRAAWVRDKEE